MRSADSSAITLERINPLRKEECKRIIGASYEIIRDCKPEYQRKVYDRHSAITYTKGSIPIGRGCDSLLASFSFHLLQPLLITGVIASISQSKGLKHGICLNDVFRAEEERQVLVVSDAQTTAFRVCKRQRAHLNADKLRKIPFISVLRYNLKAYVRL